MGVTLDVISLIDDHDDTSKAYSVQSGHQGGGVCGCQDVWVSEIIPSNDGSKQTNRNADVDSRSDHVWCSMDDAITKGGVSRSLSTNKK